MVLFSNCNCLSLNIRNVFAVVPITSYSIFLISGYIMLMLAKERSDQQVNLIQESLEKTEIQFQRVVETAFEGIVMFDIDHFKNYNDYYGHVMGDVCLRQIASAAAASVRELVDLAARYVEKNLLVYYRIQILKQLSK